MGEFFKNINWKHVLIMCIGNVFMGMGIGIFKLAGLGTDPFSGMNMAVADTLGMAYGNFQLLVNVVLLVVQVAFGRKFLGIGTVVNAVFLAYITTFFYNIYTGVLGVELTALPIRLVALCVGVVICSLGLSMYQMPDEGVAPYDSLSLIMTERWPKIPYFWHRKRRRFTVWKLYRRQSQMPKRMPFEITFPMQNFSLEKQRKSIRHTVPPMAKKPVQKLS